MRRTQISELYFGGESCVNASTWDRRKRTLCMKHYASESQRPFVTSVSTMLHFQWVLKNLCMLASASCSNEINNPRFSRNFSPSINKALSHTRQLSAHNKLCQGSPPPCYKNPQAIQTTRHHFFLCCPKRQGGLRCQKIFLHSYFDLIYLVSMPSLCFYADDNCYFFNQTSIRRERLCDFCPMGQAHRQKLDFLEYSISLGKAWNYSEFSLKRQNELVQNFK